MAIFQYQAVKSSGAACKGIIEADSERHARQMLRQQQLTPVRIQPKQDRAEHRRLTLTKPALTLFTRQLSVLMAAGVALDDALQGIIEQTDKPKIRELITQVRARVLEGYSLAQAMAAFPKAFPVLYRTTIEAGEQTGQFDQVLEKLAVYTENQLKVTQKIQQALIYPSLMLLISLGIVSFLLVFVVPNMVDVFSDNKTDLPLMTHVLLGVSDWVQSYGLYALLFIILLGVLAKQALKRSSVADYYHQTLLKLPGLAYCIRTTNLARYTHTFSILFSAGVSILESMRVSTSLMGNRLIQARFGDATTQVKEGLPFSQAMTKTNFITPMVRHLMETGEKSGQLANMMERIGEHLDNEMTRLIDTLLTLLEPAIIIIMGVIVLFIVLATLLPIFSMQQLVM